VLERLLAYRLMRLLHGSRTEAAWPALWRVLHRPTPTLPSVAVTRQRHLHLLAITQPLTLRLNVNASASTSITTHNARDMRGRDTTSEKLTHHTERLTAQRHTLAERWTLQRRSLADQHHTRQQRWIVQQHMGAHHWGVPIQALPSSPPQGPLPSSSHQYPTAFRSLFTSPTRILGRPVQATPTPSGAASTPQVPAPMIPHYSDDPRAATSLPPIPMLSPAVEHLTDQVLRTVDQRLVAARERLSRR
jgi:hypothetical protein